MVYMPGVVETGSVCGSPAVPDRVASVSGKAQGRPWTHTIFATQPRLDALGRSEQPRGGGLHVSQFYASWVKVWIEEMREIEVGQKEFFGV